MNQLYPISMDNEKISPIIGIVLLVIGIIVLFFTFFQAMNLVQNVGDFFDDQFPGSDDAKEPSARFYWNSNDLVVDFSDESQEGDAEISSWSWNFGDGESSSDSNPQHTYSSGGNYRVSLHIEDENGKKSSANTDVNVGSGNQNSGESDDFGGDFEFNLGIDVFAAAILIGILFLVMFLVGAALVKAGWNLVKPGPSTVKLKLKPKKIEIEQETFEQPRQPPPQDYYPPRGDYGRGYPETPAGDWNETKPAPPKARPGPPPPPRRK